MSIRGTNQQITSNSSLTTDKLIKGSNGSSEITLSVVSCDSSGNLTGVNNISTVTSIFGTNGVEIEMSGSTPPLCNFVAPPGIPWSLGGSCSDNRNKQISLGFLTTSNRGLLYCYDQGVGGLPLAIQYGYPGLGVTHYFESNIDVTRTKTSYINTKGGTNDITVPNVVGSLSTFTTSSLDREFEAYIASDGTVYSKCGGVTCSNYATGSYLVTFDCTLISAPVATIANASEYCFISIGHTLNTNTCTVIIRESAGAPPATKSVDFNIVAKAKK